MRILHTECSTTLGGEELRVLAESVEMTRRGHEVVLAVPPGSALHERAVEARLAVAPVLFTPARATSIVLALLRAIRERDVQVVNTHGSLDSWTGSVAGRLSSRRPVVVRTRHKSTPVSRTRRHRWLYQKLPHGVVTTGEAVRRTLIESQEIEPDRIVSIPTGVDLARFHPRPADDLLRAQLGLPAGGLLVGTVAFLRGYKGLSYFIEAAQRVLRARPQVRFVVVGDGPERPALIELMHRLRVDHAVSLVGHREDIPDLLAALDVFVLSSTEGEGLPQGLTQAMAMARAVAATEVGSVGEVVQHGRTGLLARPRDAAHLAEQISRLLEDDALRTSCGEAAKALIERQYSLEQMALRTEAFYARLLSATHRQPTSAQAGRAA